MPMPPRDALSQRLPLLAAQGLTPEGFEANVRRDLSSRQVLAGVLDSGFASQAQADVAMNAFLERREVRIVPFTPAGKCAQVWLEPVPVAGLLQSMAMFLLTPAPPMRMAATAGKAI